MEKINAKPLQQWLVSSRWFYIFYVLVKGIRRYILRRKKARIWNSVFWLSWKKKNWANDECLMIIFSYFKWKLSLLLYWLLFIIKTQRVMEYLYANILNAYLFFVRWSRCAEILTLPIPFVWLFLFLCFLLLRSHLFGLWCISITDVSRHLFYIQKQTL